MLLGMKYNNSGVKDFNGLRNQHSLRSATYLWYDIYNTCTNNFVDFVENYYD